MESGSKVSQNLKTDKFKNESANMGEGDVKNQEKNCRRLLWMVPCFLFDQRRRIDKLFIILRDKQ